MTDTFIERDGLPPRQALVVSGALVIGLAIMHWLIGAPQTARDWLMLASTALVAPTLGYLLVKRKFGIPFGACSLVFVTNMLIATW